MSQHELNNRKALVDYFLTNYKPHCLFFITEGKFDYDDGDGIRGNPDIDYATN